MLVLAAVVSVAFGWTDTAGAVPIGRVMQGVLTAILVLSFGWAWKKFPSAPPQRILPANKSLWRAGFEQVWTTTKSLYRDYRRSVFAFMCSVVAGEAFAYSLTTLSVVYLADALGLTSTEVLVFFLIAELGMVVGPTAGLMVSRWLDLKRSWLINQSCLVLACLIGSLALQRRVLGPIYVWGLVVGFFVGWHYTMQRAMFSNILPKGQDSELSGFFVYCQTILSWLPPLIYSALVQAKVPQRFALLSLCFFGLGAITILGLMPSWEALMQDVAGRGGDLGTDDGVDDSENGSDVPIANKEAVSRNTRFAEEVHA